MKIKAYTGYRERDNAHFYRTFEIVSSVPEVGEEFEGNIVFAVKELTLDCEQGNDDVYNYKYYEIASKEDEEDGSIFRDNIAIEKEEE